VLGAGTGRCPQQPQPGGVADLVACREVSFMASGPVAVRMTRRRARAGSRFRKLVERATLVRRSISSTARPGRFGHEQANHLDVPVITGRKIAAATLRKVMCVPAG